MGLQVAFGGAQHDLGRLGVDDDLEEVLGELVEGVAVDGAVAEHGGTGIVVVTGRQGGKAFDTSRVP